MVARSTTHIKFAVKQSFVESDSADRVLVQYQEDDAEDMSCDEFRGIDTDDVLEEFVGTCNDDGYVDVVVHVRDGTYSSVLDIAPVPNHCNGIDEGVDATSSCSYTARFSCYSDCETRPTRSTTTKPTVTALSTTKFASSLPKFLHDSMVVKSQ